jgi:hypothetical protein
MNSNLAFSAINEIVIELAMSGEYIHNPASVSNKILNAVILSQLPKNEKVILYSIISLDGKFLTTKEVSLKTGMLTKNISTQLKQMEIKYPTLLEKKVLKNGNFIWKCLI